MDTRTCDVIIIGGGIIGSSTAYYLTKADPRLKVVVVEKDPTYARASTTLSMSNVRIQFSLKENILISQYALSVLKNFAEEMEVNGMRPNIVFRQEGNLFLVNDPGREAAEKAYALQRSLGCRVEWWANEDIMRHYPLYKPEGFVGGTFGADDGHFDAYAALMGYKAKARSQGAQYIQDDVAQVLKPNGRVQGVKLAGQGTLSAACIVNCSGAWAVQVAESLGIRLPIAPTKRQVFVLDTAIKPQGPLPLTILPSGLYFRTETGGVILLGKSLEADTVGFDFTWDEKRFLELLWPELADFVPAFDRLKLVRGWAGLYDVNTLDYNAILGEWPEAKGFYLANGFSGHGLQQAPAVGRYLSELILGQTLSLDLSIFGPRRILENKPISEGGIV